MTKKIVEFMGDSQTILRSFPSDVRQEMGHALWELQVGNIPAIAKPFGRGVFELRDQSAAGGTFRVVYVLIIKSTVHVFTPSRRRANAHLESMSQLSTRD